MRKTFIITAIVVALAMSTITTALAQGESVNGNAANSLGKTTLDTEVSAGINYGSGIPNGNWVTAEIQGIELGLRATDRKDGMLPTVTGTNGNRVGVYEAATGFDAPDENRAEWNFEWSVDLSGATGHAEGRTIEDYSLVLEQDYTEQSLFGVLGSDPVQLPMPDTCDAVSDTLCQQSWNPIFGNSDFDMSAVNTYNLRLLLTPETFEGPPLAVKIQVNVSAN